MEFGRGKAEGGCRMARRADPQQQKGLPCNLGSLLGEYEIIDQKDSERRIKRQEQWAATTANLVLRYALSFL